MRRPGQRRRQKKYGRSSRKLVLLLILSAAVILAAFFAEYLCPYDPDAQDLSIALSAPDLHHPMGTDQYGRDMLSRVILGGRTSILSALLLTALISVSGTALGILCGWKGGITDTVIMRLADLFLAFPGLVFAMAVAALLHNGIPGAIFSLALVSWPKYARLSRSETLSIRKNSFIEAAVFSGDSGAQIVLRHILPNIAGPILVTAALDIGTMIMELAGLSFLGLGAQPPTAEWGSMMSNGRSMLQTCPWVVLSPGIAMVISVSVFNLLGDTLRDTLDPAGITQEAVRRTRHRRISNAE